MNGRQLLEFGTRGIGGIAEADHRYFFDCLNQAAADFVRETTALKNTAVITTVADQQAYDLPHDFLALYAKDRRRRLVAKYESGSNVYWPVCSSQEKIFRLNLTDAQDVPSRFAVAEADAAPDPVTGTATADGAKAGGLATLTDSAAAFVGAVNPGDLIANTSDASAGVVISVTSDTALKAALFGGGVNEWASGDAYEITPLPKFRVILEAPAASDGDTLTVPYLAKPAPIYHDAGMWRFDAASCRAIAYEGGYIYKMDYDLDAEADGHLHMIYLTEVRKKKVDMARSILQGERYPERR